MRAEHPGLGLGGAPGIVATNAHVVAGEHDAQVEVPNGPTLIGIPIAVDAGNDVALLRVGGLRPPPLRLSPRAPSGGERDPDRLSRERAADGGRRPGGKSGDGARADAYGQHIHARTVVPLRGVLSMAIAAGRW